MGPPDPRTAIIGRLADELADPQLAADAIRGLDEVAVTQLIAATGRDGATSPLLSYTPSTVGPDDVDSLWIFGFGYRLADGFDGTTTAGNPVPPPEAIVPGPTNEALARLAAEFIAQHPVPVIAQWEVAVVLDRLGVRGVISVGPDFAADGTVSYLSTAGVVDKGLRVAAEQGVHVGRAGIVCFADHAVRCVLTALAAGMTAAVPDGVELPSDYDPDSGQSWTRSRASFIPADLLARAFLQG